ncbi:unnamed protein product [Orchesella dallaii]|uniref:Chitin-binding type-2 domain-containing protein n=1 Tax=Orchesella dallaii TaxID=48710 RepID=A0ABP1S6K8_9HEXA
MNRPTTIVTIFLVWLQISSSTSISASTLSKNDKVLEINTSAVETENIQLPNEYDFKCPGEQGFYPHPEKCEVYYGCWDFRPSLRHCPSRQLFDLKYMGCNWPELTDCQDRIRPEGYPNTKTPPPPTEGQGGVTAKPINCPLDLDDGMFPDPSDCTAYYRCVYGTSYHYKCAPPLGFNENISACDYLSNVSCGSRPIKE